MKAQKQPITVREEFLPYHTKPLDSKFRITLGGKLTRTIGKRMNVESYQIFVGKNGDILLRHRYRSPAAKRGYIRIRP